MRPPVWGRFPVTAQILDMVKFGKSKKMTTSADYFKGKLQEILKRKVFPNFTKFEKKCKDIRVEVTDTCEPS